MAKARNINKKYYKPGVLKEKGTKISLKTQPYINGVIFDIDDPISSFHYYLIQIKTIINEYERLRSIPGMDKAVPSSLELNSGITGKVKLLLDYLIESPIEINIRDQEITNDILAELELNRILELNRTEDRHE